MSTLDVARSYEGTFEFPEKVNNSGSTSRSIPEVLPAIANKYNATALDNNVTLSEFIAQTIKKDRIEEAPFFVYDLNKLCLQYLKWKRCIPRAEPFYAVKCNPNPVILETLAALGCGFDCASVAEIDAVIGHGVSSSRIIFANPCKQSSHVRKAAEKDVRWMTFDNEAELHKIKKFYPTAELVLRILPDESQSLMKFGSKFGAHPDDFPHLLQVASDLGLNVIGVSFHVGSGCYSASCFENSLQLAKDAFDLAEQYGYQFSLLDIGGGFPGTDSHKPSFEEIGEAITGALARLFPPHIRVIAEPGRFFACSTAHLAVSVFARRYNSDAKEDEPEYLYYINDGVYGSFNCIFFDHACPVPYPLLPKGDTSATCNIFGPTCDSMDLVCQNIQLPELDCGDWLVFEDMGAYTSAAASSFNGFRTLDTYYVTGLKDF